MREVYREGCTRLNHTVADGYLVANVFRLLEKEMGILSCSPCSMA